MKRKFLSMGWMFYWILAVFPFFLAVSVWLTAAPPKGVDVSLVVPLLWVCTGFIAVAIFLGVQQTTEISDAGILQKNPFGKKIFFTWEEIRLIGTLNIFGILRFIYITNREFTNAELWRMSPFDQRKCLIRVAKRKSILNEIKTFYKGEIVILKSK